jgi:hypothetical protein
MTARTILGDVTLAYGQFNERYRQATHRGDYDRADEALSVMQEIERCVSVNETSTSWRNTIAKLIARERKP